MAPAGFEWRNPKEVQEVLDIAASEEKAKADAKAAIEREKQASLTTPAAVNKNENDGKDGEKPATSGVDEKKGGLLTKSGLGKTRQLELYRIMLAMWQASRYMKGYNHVLKAGREVSKEASLPLAKEVYDTYSKSHDQKTFEKLLVDHNVDPKIIVELTKSEEKTGLVDANGTPSVTPNTPEGPKSSSNGSPKPSGAPNASTTPPNNGPESGQLIIPVNQLDEFMAKSDRSIGPEDSM